MIILCLAESISKRLLPAAVLNATDSLESVSGSTYMFPVTKKSPSATESTSITCLSAYSVPLTTTSPPNKVTCDLTVSPVPIALGFPLVCDPETKNRTSLPTLVSMTDSVGPAVVPARSEAIEPLYTIPPRLDFPAIPPDRIICFTSNCDALKSFAILTYFIFFL